MFYYTVHDVASHRDRGFAYAGFIQSADDDMLWTISENL